MESVAGCIVNLPRDPKDVQGILKSYTGKQTTRQLTLTSQALYEMVRRGSTPALKAVLEKRLGSEPAKLSTFAAEIQGCQLSVVLKGVRKPLSAAVLTEFIKEHFDDRDQRRLLGVNATRSIEEVLDKVRSAAPLDTTYNKIFWKMYHENPSEDLLRKMLVVQCQNKTASEHKFFPSDLLKVVNGANAKNT